MTIQQNLRRKESFLTQNNANCWSHTIPSAIHPSFPFPMIDTPGFFIHAQRESLHSGGKEVFAETKGGRPTGAEAAMVEGPGCSLSAAGPTWSSSSHNSPGALRFQPHPLGDRQELQQRRNYAYKIISQALPTRYQRPTPLAYPIWLTAPTHALGLLLPAPGLGLLSSRLAKFCTKAGQWVRTAQGCLASYQGYCGQGREPGQLLLLLQRELSLPVTLCQKEKNKKKKKPFEGITRSPS